MPIRGSSIVQPALGFVNFGESQSCRWPAVFNCRCGVARPAPIRTGKRASAHGRVQEIAASPSGRNSAHDLPDGSRRHPKPVPTENTVNTLRPLALILLIALVAAWRESSTGHAQTPATDRPAGNQPAAAEPQDDPTKVDRPLQTFMRGKLTASTKILEGLALEDLVLVKEGAIELNRMSAAAKWRQHEDVLYRQFSAQFRQTTADLIESSREGLLDRSALKWMDATMNCIECHRYVRNKLVVDAAGERR